MNIRLKELFTELNSLRQMMYKCGVENPYSDLARLIEKLFLLGCDLARQCLDKLDDPIVATGMRLHYVNNVSWYETAQLTGVSNIRERCHEYLRKDGKCDA